jgi:hypothetical protein
MCEDITDGTSKACPTQWTDANALTALFSNTAGMGLNLGDIPAKAKYRFTIKNLLVTDTDTSTNGQTVNTATIETTAMLTLSQLTISRQFKSRLLVRVICPITKRMHLRQKQA